MKNTSIALLASTLILVACGRQETVEEVQADRAAANAPAAVAKPVSDGRTIATGKFRNYLNPAHGYAITLPEGWVRNDARSNADGIVYDDPGAGAHLKVLWAKSSSDADIQNLVDGMNEGAEAVEGNFTSPGEYRGSANDGSGNRVAIKVLKLPDGSAVSATVTYPEMLSEQYAAIGKAALESLLVAPKG